MKDWLELINVYAGPEFLPLAFEMDPCFFAQLGAAGKVKYRVSIHLYSGYTPCFKLIHHSPRPDGGVSQIMDILYTFIGATLSLSSPVEEKSAIYCTFDVKRFHRFRRILETLKEDAPDILDDCRVNLDRGELEGTMVVPMYIDRIIDSIRRGQWVAGSQLPLSMWTSAEHPDLVAFIQGLLFGAHVDPSQTRLWFFLGSGMTDALADQLCRLFQGIHWNRTNVGTYEFLGQIQQWTTIGKTTVPTAIPVPEPLFEYSFISGAEGVVPVRHTSQDVGWDLTATGIRKVLNNCEQRTGRIFFLGTGIRVAPSDGYYLQLVARSSIAKYGYMLANGVGIIDPNYRGEVLIVLVQIRDNAEPIGELLPFRCAQLVVAPFFQGQTAREVPELNWTSRGEGGFGSTG